LQSAAAAVARTTSKTLDAKVVLVAVVRIQWVLAALVLRRRALLAVQALPVLVVVAVVRQRWAAMTRLLSVEKAAMAFHHP
jgi:hypothetical protein